ncbi:DNA repair protein RecO [Canibacter sp. lx-45]|uniref:DNA repair protein RecO n=1 Tax=Canibacter zhuwentaonis TaxID=2837491 RepID=UPI001BDBBA16|nr:DNA repair protein RecO [Canibacter zhuwentaonis]MBT1035692.1 DNA repair protein RecO [Canibacter zhuwentaonis]
MAVLRDYGIVLRTHKLGESDRIVSMLTMRHGLRRIVARGVRKTSSKIGARLEPFSVVDIQFYEGRSLDSVNQVETVALYGSAISANYEKYQVGMVIAETAYQITESATGAEQFQLLAGALRVLANARSDPQLVRDSYMLRALAFAGWQIELLRCVNCQENYYQAFFSAALGGTVCQVCKTEPLPVLSENAIALLVALLRGDWDTAFASSSRARKEASGTVKAFARWHLERALKSL